MIHLATYRLPVSDEDGNPAELDIGLLEKRIADAFRKLGFADVWMAEDVALTVEEKIRMSDARFVTREEVDSIVLSVLNASGFRDVAQEYALGCGRDSLEDAKKEMKPWNGCLSDVLRRRLPLTEKQICDVEHLASKVLDASGIAVATDKFLVELAVHLLVNNSVDHAHFVDSNQVGGKAVCCGENPCVSWQGMKLGAELRGMISSGILKAMPFSEIFPRARVSVMIGSVASVYSDGWLTPLGVCVAFGRIAPCVLEMLCAMRQELSARHPLQSDSPSHVVFPGFMEYLEQNPSFWKRRDRLEIRDAVAQVMDEQLVSVAEFPVMVSIR